MSLSQLLNKSIASALSCSAAITSCEEFSWIIRNQLFVLLQVGAESAEGEGEEEGEEY